MPAIYPGELLPDVPMPYVVIGFVVLCCIGIYMRRKERDTRMRLEEGGGGGGGGGGMSSTKWPSSMQRIVEEKEAMFFPERRGGAGRYTQGGMTTTTHQQRQWQQNQQQWERQRGLSQPPNFTPFPSSTISSTAITTENEIPLSNASYYDTNEIYDDEPPTYLDPLPSSTSSSTYISAASSAEEKKMPVFDGSLEFGLPRRRSYTKTTSQGMEVSGEIVVGEGWRRHTRVFGGGVCKACEESERRMTS